MDDHLTAEDDAKGDACGNAPGDDLMAGVLGPVAPVEPGHRYTSTACVHRLHARCRDVCKFCAVRCLCACHDGRP